MGRVAPVRADDAGLDEPLHVGLDRERDDVGVEPRLDGAALLARGAERGLEADVLARVGLLELGDDLVVDDLGGRVRDERESCAEPPPPEAPASGVFRAAAAGDREAGDGREQAEAGEWVRTSVARSSE